MATPAGPPPSWRAEGLRSFGAPAIAPLSRKCPWASQMSILLPSPAHATPDARWTLPGPAQASRHGHVLRHGELRGPTLVGCLDAWTLQDSRRPVSAPPPPDCMPGAGRPPMFVESAAPPLIQASAKGQGLNLQASPFIRPTHKYAVDVNLLGAYHCGGGGREGGRERWDFKGLASILFREPIKAT